MDQTLRQLNKVWQLEIDTMGYRKPLPDHGKGGNNKLDVYLKDVGPQGYYGYCTTERKAYRYTYSGYCVLDDDFDPDQFNGAPALDSLKVTAAHEFFHAVQYAYDAAEDPLVHGVHADLDGGAVRRRRQRQPAVPRIGPARSAGVVAGRLRRRRLRAVRQLGLVGVPLRPLRHRHREVGVDQGRRLQGAPPTSTPRRRW